MCSLIGAALRLEPDIRISGAATDVNKALDLIKTRHSNVVLVSTNLPNNGTLTLVQAARSVSSAKILVVGLAEVEEVILHYIEAGASGYVFEEDSIDMLVKNIRVVHSGEALVSPEVAATLIARVAELAALRPLPAPRTNGSYDLTPREAEVLDLIGEGLSNQEIADRLVIEVGTVKNHVHSILQKLEVDSRQDAAKFSNGHSRYSL
jgi:DNA-binding NarL/FixJ family response regulator